MTHHYTHPAPHTRHTPTIRLSRKPQPNQRVQRERTIPDPRRAIVPVTRPADVLRQAERGRGDDRARGLVDQELEREGRAVHGFFPGAGVG